MDSAEARFNNSLRPRKPEGSSGRTTQDVHLDSHTAPELWRKSNCWSLLYSAILRSRADSRRSHVILRGWIAFYSAFLNINRSGVLTALAWLVPHEAAAISALSVHGTPYNHAPCHVMQSHIRKVHAYLAVTSHLHFWQNDRGLLRATAVTRG